MSHILCAKKRSLNPNYSFLQNMVHIAESTVGRRYAGWFIRNTEHAQRVYDTIRNAPLPIAPKPAAKSTATDPQTSAPAQKSAAPKVAWGGVKVA